MQRRRLFWVLAAAVIAGSAAAAQSLQDGLVRQLRGQGYETFDIGRTLLGRVRIVAEGREQRREIIFNPRTGEILRDYWQLLDGAEADGGGLISSGSGSSGSGSSGSGHDDDDDDDEDDDDENDDDDDGGSGGSGGSGGNGGSGGSGGDDGN